MDVTSIARGGSSVDAVNDVDADSRDYGIEGALLVDTAPRDSASQPPLAPYDLPLHGDSDEADATMIGRVICESSGPNLSQVHFRLLPGRHTTAGRIVGVRGVHQSGHPILTLVRVDEIYEQNPHEDAASSTVSDVIPFETKYAKEGHSTVIYRAAVAETLEEIVLGEDGVVHRVDAVETLPLSGSDVIDVPPELIGQALSFAPSPETGLSVGHMHGAPDVPVILKREIVQTHLFLCGGIGRGKSYGRGVVAEELHAHGIPQVNIDPMGEMVDATTALGGLNVRPGSGGFTLPLSALQPDEVIDAIPAINKGTNIETLVQYAQETLLDEVALKQNTAFGVADLIAKIEVLAPDLDMKAQTFRPAMQRAKSLHSIPYIGRPFAWQQHLVPGAMINIDCRGFSVADLRLITAAVARDLQRLARGRQIPFVAFSIDEAHLIAPNDDKVVTTQVLREIARIGRHYRIGLIMTTQSPADMDRSILKRLLTRFVFAIESDQLDALRGIFADAPKAMIARLPKLPIGTCVVTGVSETIKHATLLDFRHRLTPVGGSTPDIFADLATRGWTSRRALGEAPGRDRR